ERFSALTGRGVLCNRPYSGTQVIADYGREHLATGAFIVYTSQDSVFQIAAHEDVVPLEELYAACRIARSLLTGRHAVGRVIARPFRGEEGAFFRTAGRHDFSLEPTGETMLDRLKANGKAVIGVGKISDIFAGRGLTEDMGVNRDNDDGMRKTDECAKRDFEGLCFVNLVDFDMLYGHRNDVDGYARAISRFDRWLGDFLPKLRKEDLLIVTADHGCDPSTPSTDHSREYVPLLMTDKKGRNYGTRETFADISATVLRYFDLEPIAGTPIAEGE
ncbi:MAG: phosphopentomutase, partial [Christensenellaceae bacterium]